MVTLETSTFNECLDKSIDVMLYNFSQVVDAASFEEPEPQSDILVFKDKYKNFQEQRLLSGAAANIIDSASVILGMCSEIKQELLINGVSQENVSIKARYFTLVDYKKKMNSCLDSFSSNLDETIKSLEAAIYTPFASRYVTREDSDQKGSHCTP